MRQGNDRRQGLLREQQVISLFGAEQMEGMAWQSQSMPVPVPLAFGAGYFKSGDWMPATHEPERWDPWASWSARIMARPYAGFDSLPEMRETIAELRRHRVAPIAGGGFASVSDFISEATTGGKLQQLYYQKASNTTAAGAGYWLWMMAGQPGAGVIPTANVASTAPTSATAGALNFNNAAGGDTLHWISGQGVSSTAAAGSLLFADMTLIVQPILATTTAQTITGSPTRYQSNGQNGVLPFCFKGTAADANAAAIMTLTYTESITGTTGRAPATDAGTATTPANRSEFTDGRFFLPLVAGDQGVRRIETARWQTARSTASAWGLAKPYFWMPFHASANLQGDFVDLLNRPAGLPQIIDSAAITTFLQAGATTSGLIQALLQSCSG